MADISRALLTTERWFQPKCIGLWAPYPLSPYAETETGKISEGVEAIVVARQETSSLAQSCNKEPERQQANTRKRQAL